MTATGKKSGMRLITVVMNVDTTQNRNNDTIGMMNYGFNMYSLDKVVNSKDILGNVKVSLGKKENVDVTVKESVTVLNDNQTDKRNITYDVQTNEVVAPIKVGDEIGKLNIYEDGKFKYSVPLTVMEDVDKTNIFMMFLRNLKDIISMNF